MNSEIRGSRVLITGGLGFIGSNLAHRLVSLGATVTLVDSLIPQYGGNLFSVSDIRDKVNINFSDVRDIYSMRHLVKNQDYLFNLAGQTSHMDSMSNPHDDLEINCRAQLDILETCREFNPEIKIIFASTRQIYGKPDYLPVDERHQLKPVDVNGINKIAGEQYHILYNNVYGIRTCVLRLTNTYGPRMRIKDARQTFLGIWIRHVIEEKPFEVWEGTQLRDLTYVEDAINAFLAAAVSEKADGKVFNLGGDRIISLKDLAELLVTINGKGEYHLRPYPPDRKKIDIGDYYSDYGLINRELGWSPQVNLDDGLRSTLEFFRCYYEEYK
jgi:nucleoside-diphosphate-sugar epimerase